MKKHLLLGLKVRAREVYLGQSDTCVFCSGGGHADVMKFH